jgi:hypothetical protein
MPHLPSNSPFARQGVDPELVDRVREMHDRIRPRTEPVERTASKDDLEEANNLLGQALQDLEPGSGVYHLVEEARALVYQQLD